VRYGGQSSYIVAAWDPLALDMCISLQLPCYNATHMAKDMEHRVASYNETAPESILAQQLLGWQPVQHPLGRRMQAHSTGVTNSNSHRSAMPPHQRRARQLREADHAAGSTTSVAIAHAFGTHGFLVLAWARVLLLEQVLQLGYTVRASRCANCRNLGQHASSTALAASMLPNLCLPCCTIQNLPCSTSMCMVQCRFTCQTVMWCTCVMHTQCLTKP
jgi:hypothetical protein